MSQLTLPKLDFKSHNNLVEFIEKIGVTPDVGKPLYASVWFSRNLNISQISELKKALLKYGLCCQISGPYNLSILNENSPYFLLIFTTSKNRDIVIKEIERIKLIGKLDGKTRKEISNIPIENVVPNIPVENVIQNKKNVVANNYKIYFIIGLVALFFVLLIKKK